LFVVGRHGFGGAGGDRGGGGEDLLLLVVVLGWGFRGANGGGVVEEGLGGYGFGFFEDGVVGRGHGRADFVGVFFAFVFFCCCDGSACVGWVGMRRVRGG